MTGRAAAYAFGYEWRELCVYGHACWEREQGAKSHTHWALVLACDTVAQYCVFLSFRLNETPLERIGLLSPGVLTGERCPFLKL